MYFIKYFFLTFSMFIRLTFSELNDLTARFVKISILACFKFVALIVNIICIHNSISNIR